MKVLDLVGRTKKLFEEDMARIEADLSRLVADSSFLVVGGAGSIGQAVSIELFKRNPRALHIVDLSENNLVELVRTLRSGFGYIKGDFKTFALDCGSDAFSRLLRAQEKYDYILNLSAMKHVRNEEDAYTLCRMIEVNVENNLKILRAAGETKRVNYFSVSTDKATNPVNAMGATKRVMELFLMRESKHHQITTARFANVAFSDGSLLRGFQLRFEKQQPFSAPTNIRRYFITPEESGQLCLVSSLLGENRDIFFPRLSSELALTSFTDIAIRYLNDKGYQAHLCQSEDEARGKVGELMAKGRWPCYFFESDTTGEKDFEEFYTGNEELDLTSYKNFGVIKSLGNYDAVALEDFSRSMMEYRKSEVWSKRALIEILGRCVPEFAHSETNKYLDHRM